MNNFFATKEMQPSVMNNLKSMFVRSNLSQQELGTLMVSFLLLRENLQLKVKVNILLTNWPFNI